MTDATSLIKKMLDAEKEASGQDLNAAVLAIVPISNMLEAWYKPGVVDDVQTVLKAVIQRAKWVSRKIQTHPLMIQHPFFMDILVRAYRARMDYDARLN